MLGLGSSITSASVPSEDFSLGDISGLQLWLKYNTDITTVSGEVSQWNDQSGNDRHAKQTTSGRRPAFSSGDVDFDGVDDRLELDSDLSFGVVSFFAVIDPQQATPTTESVVGSSSVNYIRVHQGGDVDRVTFRVTSGNISDQTNLTEDLPTDKFLLTVIRQSGTTDNVIVRVNGSVVTHTANDDSDSSDNFTINSIATSGGGLNPFDGLINEIAAYNVEVSGGDLTNVENDIMTRNSIS